MAGHLITGWEKAAVAHANCRRILPQRRVSSICARRFPKPEATFVCRLSISTCRRNLWRFSAAEEVAEEAASGTEETPEGEGSEAVEEQSTEETEVSEHTALVESVAAESLKALEDGELGPEDLSRAFDEIKEMVATLSSSVDTANARAALSSEEEKERQQQYLRLSADFDNFRKRSATERAQLKESVTSDVVLQLLPIIDNFELARGQVQPTNEGEEKINNSYQGLYKQMVDTFKSLGVEPVEAVGTPFDPEVHEAIMREPNDDVPDGTVLEEFRRGFLLKGQLMRAAMVKVSHSDAAGAPADSEGVPEESSDPPSEEQEAGEKGPSA